MLAFLFTLFLFQPAHAKPGDMRYGLELELGEAQLGAMSGIFDFEKLQRAERTQSLDLPNDFYDDYLRDNPGALQSLPAELREKLTQGLTLKSVVEKAEAPKLPVAESKLILPEARPILAQRGILGADGNALSASPREILRADAPAPPKLAAPAMKEQGGLALPARFDWEELHKRWKALDFRAKANLVSWEKLGPNRKGALMLALLPTSKVERLAIEVKDTASPEVKDLFSRLDIGHDGEGIAEIRHLKSVNLSDQAAFLKDVRSLAKLSGMENKVFRPDESKIQGVSFHYHVSREGADISKNLKLYNDFLLAKRVNAGIVNDLKQDGRFLYGPLRSRGLIRMLDPSHMEQRWHYGKLEDEFAFVNRVMQASPEEARAIIEPQIKKLFDRATINRFVRQNPRLISEFLQYFAKAEQESMLQRMKALPRIMAKDDASIWRRLPSMLKSQSYEMQDEATDFLKRQAKWPDSFLRSLGDITKNPKLDTEFFPVLEEFAKPEHFEILHNIMQSKFPEGLEKRKKLVRRAWTRTWKGSEDKVLEFVRDQKIDIPSRMDAAVEATREFKGSLRKKAWEELVSRPEFRKNSQAWFEAVLEDPQIYPFVWPEIVKELKNAPGDSLSVRAIFKSEILYADAPPEGFAAIAEFANRATGLNFSYCRTYLLADRQILPDSVWEKVAQWSKSPKGELKEFSDRIFQLYGSQLRGSFRDKILSQASIEDPKTRSLLKMDAGSCQGFFSRLRRP